MMSDKAASTGTRLAFTGKGFSTTISYASILLAALGLKAYYSRAGADDLLWILTPVAYLIETVSDFHFTYESGAGFIDRARAVVIAPACAGVNFMIIVFGMTAFSLVSMGRTWVQQVVWLAYSAALAYLLTIVANTLRIIIAVRLYQADIYNAIITVERVHRMAGTVIYLLLLCGVYSYIVRFKTQRDFQFQRIPTRAILIPLIWYGCVTIGIPLAKRSDEIITMRFVEHCATIFMGSGFVFIGCHLINKTKQYIWPKRRIG